MSDTVLLLEFGMASAVLALSVLIYVRRVKEKMRRSVLRFERIRKKLED